MMESQMCDLNERVGAEGSSLVHLACESSNELMMELMLTVGLCPRIESGGARHGSWQLTCPRAPVFRSGPYPRTCPTRPDRRRSTWPAPKGT